MRLDKTGSAGWLTILAFAAIYDAAVIKKGKQSLSEAIWENTKHSYYGPVIAGFWAALTFHFFIDKPKLERGNNERKAMAGLS